MTLNFKRTMSLITLVFVLFLLGVKFIYVYESYFRPAVFYDRIFES